TSTSQEEKFHCYFNATQSFLTSHCGIVSLSADIKLTPLTVLDNDWHLFVKIEHQQQHFQPIYLLTIYAPATSPTQRRQFFTTLYNSEIFQEQQPYRERMIITGDFNYRYHLNTPAAWFTILQHHFTNCINPDPHNKPLLTFHRSDFTMSTIDYIYASSSVSHTVKSREVSYVAKSWSDHALLFATFDMGSSTTGKGYWRGNPLILTFKDFRHQLATAITRFFERIDSNSMPQHQWEELKRLLKQ
ncbi:hypothetical protein BDB00DRAFT_774024, partial [Zychaea mexicana]|uniref:uncharacterized protein n=1 Tax=Zychaea mexicana TaxID=64656 RepID=UPI0022FE7A59